MIYFIMHILTWPLVVYLDYRRLKRIEKGVI